MESRGGIWDCSELPIRASTAHVRNRGSGSVARRDRHGQIAADGTRQVFLDFIVPGNGFLAARVRVAPDRVTAPFAQRPAAVLV